MPQERSPHQGAADVRRVMEEIKEEVRQRRERGEYPPEIAAEIDELESSTSFSIDRLTRAVTQLRQAIAFTAVISTESSKPYVGGAISGLKRGVQKLTQWYVAGVLDQVRVFAEMSLKSQNLVVDQLKRLDDRVAVLEELVREDDGKHG